MRHVMASRSHRPTPKHESCSANWIAGIHWWAREAVDMCLLTLSTYLVKLEYDMPHLMVELDVGVQIPSHTQHHLQQPTSVPAN